MPKLLLTTYVCICSLFLFVSNMNRFFFSFKFLLLFGEQSLLGLVEEI